MRREILHNQRVSIGLKKSFLNIQIIPEIYLFKSTAKAEALKFNLEIKETSKKMFLSGEWDATSKLLENKDLIENKLKDLPYIKLNN